MANRMPKAAYYRGQSRVAASSLLPALPCRRAVVGSPPPPPPPPAPPSAPAPSRPIASSPPRQSRSIRRASSVAPDGLAAARTSSPPSSAKSEPRPAQAPSFLLGTVRRPQLKRQRFLAAWTTDASAGWSP